MPSVSFAPVVSGEMSLSFKVPAGLRWAVEESSDLRVWSRVGALHGPGATDDTVAVSVPTTSDHHKFFRFLLYP